jgi:hypothetical protein
MQTYYEKVLNRMRRPVLLVAVALVALLLASGVAMGVNSAEAGKYAASDEPTTPPAPLAPATDTDFRTVSFNLPSEGRTGRQIFRYAPGSPNHCAPCRVDFSSPVLSGTAALTLNGFRFNYLTSDSHTDVVEADLDFERIGSGIESDKVFIVIETAYHDKDTPSLYNGYVTATVIANVQ